METKTVTPDPNLSVVVDYAASLDCIHCGLCIQACPTFALTGREGSSPRGRIHLMRAVGEGRLAPDNALKEELDFCLGCRRCESICPAGVRYGHMLAVTRDSLARTHTPPLLRMARFVGLRLVLPHRSLLSVAAGFLRLVQITGLVRGLARLVPQSSRLRALAALPPVPPRRERVPLAALIPATAPTPPDAEGEVAVLEGCVMPQWLGHVNRATARTVTAAGATCLTAPGHVCCGALHSHNGDLSGARTLARSTMNAYDKLLDQEGRPLTVVVNSAGCGAHMKEYEDLFEPGTSEHVQAGAFSARVRDYAEWIAPRLPELQAAPDIPLPVAFDDPCHLCHGQSIRSSPRAALDAVPGLLRIEMDDSEACCGSAGTYSLQRPADAQAVFASRASDFAASGARTLVTANPGCQIQWTSGLASSGANASVLHLAEVLERALPAAPGR